MQPQGRARDGEAQAAIAAGDVDTMRLIAAADHGVVTPEIRVRLLEALYGLGELDQSTMESALRRELVLGRELVAAGAACLPVMWDASDTLTWRLVHEGLDWWVLPRNLPLRGLRFVLLALDRTDGSKLTDYLGAAELTADELSALVDHLASASTQVRQRACRLREPAGDADALLAGLGLASAVPLARLILRSTAPAARVGFGSHHPTVWDRSEILAAAAEAGEEATRGLLEVMPSEFVAAALGWNRAAVVKRVKHNALDGIAASGLLPLTEGESVLDRYAALQEVARRGPKLGPNRRHTHAAAVEIALAHLAQVAGFADATRLEWECEARLAPPGTGTWTVGDYAVTVTADAALTVARDGTPLKSVPAAVRPTPEYAEARARQEALRTQARRMRSGLIERLVATAATLAPDELTLLRTLPAGAAMLPALLWRDAHDHIGLLDEVDTTGPVTAAHPFLLLEREQLARWQAEIFRRRIRQPVKQAFRELYLLTPAERDDGFVSRRFAGHVVVGRMAAQLLSGRGWRTNYEYSDVQALLPAGPFAACLAADLHGYWGMSDVALGGVWFVRTELGRFSARHAVPLPEVPPILLSEVMRDLDLIVSAAPAAPFAADVESPVSAARAALLTTLIADLGLSRVRVEGHHAIVTGTLATYRVHLASGSIHLEPGGYLCIVPAGFAARRHEQLFLPFEEDDPMTSVVLSKVLLVADDHKIKDESILRQIRREAR